MTKRTISRVAKEAGVGVETVRFYERRGLIEQPVSPIEGWREYPTDTASTIRFIKRSQELGFTLKEIKELLGFRSANRNRCGEVRHSAEKKMQEIEKKIRDLKRIRKALGILIQTCSVEEGDLDCPILNSLEN